MKRGVDRSYKNKGFFESLLLSENFVTIFLFFFGMGLFDQFAIASESVTRC